MCRRGIVEFRMLSENCWLVRSRSKMDLNSPWSS